MSSCVDIRFAHLDTEIGVTDSEKERMGQVLSLLPSSPGTVLEIGARHGVMTRQLAARCKEVVALDLKKPSFHIDHVTPVQGDVQSLQFEDDSFDCVVCTEVLEHLPNVKNGAREIVRVAKSHILIGVPYRQDLRVGRMTCGSCGKINPSYGHLNVFDEKTLEQLFPDATIAQIKYISSNQERTNSLAAWLQDLAGNPYGSYDQEESCIWCHRKLERPTNVALWRRVAGAVGTRLYEAQVAINKPRPTWMLVLFEKTGRRGKDSASHGDQAGRRLAPVQLQARREYTTTAYIIETIHSRNEHVIVNRYPTLLLPEEVMDERTIRILSERQKPFENQDVEYVTYRVEGYDRAGQWRFTKRRHRDVTQMREMDVRDIETSGTRDASITNGLSSLA